MDKDAYRDMVQRAHKKLHGATAGTELHGEIERFLFMIGRLRTSWRDAHPGQQEPHVVFTDLFALSTDGKEGTFKRTWIDLFLDDPDAARAVFDIQIAAYDHCVKQRAACCKKDRPIICAFDAGKSGAPQSADIGCFATLCHTCLKVLPLKF